jgi:hypothetical protein
MAFLTESRLMEKAKSFETYKSASYIYFSESIEQAQITVFLSHSHKDKELVKGLIKLLDEQELYIYVDWNDSSMPRITSGETAKKIKERIKDLQLFFFLATKNSLNSKWCPWELGVADSLKNWSDILIIPISDPAGNFEGNEYLQIYQHLELTYFYEPYIVKPGFMFSKVGEEALFESNTKEYGGIPLRKYLLEKND